MKIKNVILVAIFLIGMSATVTANVVTEVNAVEKISTVEVGEMDSDLMELEVFIETSVITLESGQTITCSRTCWVYPNGQIFCTVWECDFEITPVEL